MAKILVVNIGNSFTKCFIYEVSRNDLGNIRADEIHQEKKVTPRGSPYDLRDRVRNLVYDASEAHHPDCGIITAFGDAFIHFDPKENCRPQFVFADEEIGPRGQLFYEKCGFPDSDYIGIKSVHSLRFAKQSEWIDMVPVNAYIASELTNPSPMECSRDHVFASKRNWDITQASATGDYDFTKQNWIWPGYPRNKPLPIYDSHEVFGTLECKKMLPNDPDRFPSYPLMIGGLDNAFLDTTEQTPYIVAGTWLVVSAIMDTFEPTYVRGHHGVRWLLSGNRRYLAQTVRKITNVSVEDVEHIFRSLQTLGLGGDQHQKIRVLGGWSRELIKHLRDYTIQHHFDFDFLQDNSEFSSTAIFAYSKHMELLCNTTK